ncbi:thiol-disulfide isomerase [Chromatiales bacterium (ex Bugula neritina AB1)]|nr:thiol-disulfide isomerase [Chromatiales bacterium (ex Bugula neritina AB1)]
MINEMAPELRVPLWLDASGEERQSLQLADLGTRYKVIFCFQHWCPGCHSHGFPKLKSMVDKLAAEEFGFAVVQTVFEGSETNTYERIGENQLKYALDVPFGHDVPQQGRRLPSLMEDYQTGGTPWFTIIDPDNRIIYSDFHISLDNISSWVKDRNSR